MEVHAHVPKFGSTLRHWLLEGVLITFSVLLGFGVAQYRESRQNHEIAARALQDLQAEVEHNLAAVEPQIVLHRRWAIALAKEQAEERKANPPAGKTARDIFLATWPDFDPRNPAPPFATLRRVAWDTALSTGALRFIDYDVTTKLSDIYNVQSAVGQAVAQLPYSTTSFFDPASRVPSVQQLAFVMDAVRLSEMQLRDLYKTHLPAIKAAATKAKR